MNQSQKTLTIRLSSLDYATLKSMADERRMSMASLLLHLLDEEVRARRRPLTPKEQAIADYHAWAASPPQDLHTWDLSRCNQERDTHLEVYRKRAGNATPSDMPMPDWLKQQSLNNVPANSRAPAPSLNTAQFASSPYATWTLPALQAQYLQVLTTDAPLDPALRHWLDTREAEES